MQLGFIEIDEDIIQNPAYWVITGGAIVALLIGFSLNLGSMVGGGDSSSYSIPFIWRAVIIILIPVIAYFITMKMQRS